MSPSRATLARRPLLCLVTDRRRLAAPGASDEAARDALLAQLAEAVDAGVDLIQIREPDLPADRLLDLVTRAVALVSGSAQSSTRIVVNDRLDVALAAGAHGVHLRGVSVDASRVRAAIDKRAGDGVGASEFLVGRSVHGVDEAVAAEAAGGLDYLVLGTMFPTVSKPGASTLHPDGHSPPAGSPGLAGPETLRAAARACRLPILAIGGITREHVGEVAEAGASGVAAIGLFLDRPLRAVVADLRARFAERTR